MASTSLSRTNGTPTNADKCTFSCWVKRSGIGSGITTVMFANYNSSDERAKIEFSADALRFLQVNGGSFTAELKTNRLFRDTSAWYHIVVAIDTTQATSSNRIKFYVNGVQETSFATSSYPAQNLDIQLNKSSLDVVIGQQGNSSLYFDGSMAHFHFIDGTAYDADNFGETDSTTGIWKPKTAPSVTYGTNGFFLKFENSGAFGTDSSGNSNTFTLSGTMTQTIDTPSNVFATMNPLNVPTSNAPTFSNGNLTVVTAVNGNFGATSTLGASQGKYYAEFKVTDLSAPLQIGITYNPAETARTNVFPGDRADGWGYYSTDGKYFNNNTGNTYGNSYTTNDIIGIALDLDNSKLYFSKNGTWQNSGDPESGATGTGAISITSDETYFFCGGDGSSSPSATYQANFGNGYFGTTAVSSAQNPDDGIGIFEYDVPTGYRALCTKSINAEEYD